MEKINELIEKNTRFELYRLCAEYKKWYTKKKYPDTLYYFNIFTTEIENHTYKF